MKKFIDLKINDKIYQIINLDIIERTVNGLELSGISKLTISFFNYFSKPFINADNTNEFGYYTTKLEAKKELLKRYEDSKNKSIKDLEYLNKSISNFNEQINLLTSELNS